MIDLSVDICGIRFKNPIIVAAGPCTRDVLQMKRCIDAGAAGVVAKTVSFDPSSRIKPRPEYRWENCEYVPAKRVTDRIPLGYTLWARDTFACLPVEEYVKDQLVRAKRICKERDAVLIGSVGGGRNAAEWAELASKVDEVEPDMIELDLSCPATPMWSKIGKGVLEIAQSPDAVAEVVKAVKKEANAPIVVKTTLFCNSPPAVAEAAEKAGADGVTMFNRFHGLAVDIWNEEPMSGGVNCGSGSPSGSWIRYFSLRQIALTAKKVKIPIFGSYGINTWEHVIEFLMCGCAATQSCTAVMLAGPRLITETVEGVEEFLKKKGYESVRDVIGVVLPKTLETYEDYFEKQPPLTATVDQAKCNGCGTCLDICYYNAIQVKERSAEVIREKCVGCMSCHYLCPNGAISMIRGENEIYLRAKKSLSRV